MEIRRIRPMACRLLATFKQVGLECMIFLLTRNLSGTSGSFSYSDPTLADGEKVAIKFETECSNQRVRIVGHLTAGNMSSYEWSDYYRAWRETHFLQRASSTDEQDTLLAYDGNYYASTMNRENISFALAGKGMPDGNGFAVDFTWECYGSWWAFNSPILGYYYYYYYYYCLISGHIIR